MFNSLTSVVLISVQVLNYKKLKSIKVNICLQWPLLSARAIESNDSLAFQTLKFCNNVRFLLIENWSSHVCTRKTSTSASLLVAVFLSFYHSQSVYCSLFSLDWNLSSTHITPATWPRCYISVSCNFQCNSYDINIYIITIIHVLFALYIFIYLLCQINVFMNDLLCMTLLFINKKVSKANKSRTLLL